MKKAIGWMTAWFLFILGDLISKLMNTSFTGWMYPAYSKVMLASIHIQDWCGASGPWDKK